MELAPRMCPAAGFGNAQSEQRLVAAVIVAHQRTAPLPEELAGMTTATGLGKVKHDSLCRGPALLAVAILAHISGANKKGRPSRAVFKSVNGIAAVREPA